MVIQNPWTSLRELTDARIALGRAGHSLPTQELLAFQLAHAKARDAVRRPLDIGCFAGLRPLLLKSMARDRNTYLRHPDLGRRLAPESAGHLNALDGGPWDIVLVIADGLSAAAVERHALPFLEHLHPQLAGWRIAPVCVVEQGRVAIGDEIGERAGAAMVGVLIGERPGLSAPDSMGVYLTWHPRVGRTDAERNCVSNIRPEGLPPGVAAVRVAWLMHAAREHQISGISLNSALSSSHQLQRDQSLRRVPSA
jgi:ethanolamine ammonia-lyase small subunit